MLTKTLYPLHLPYLERIAREKRPNVASYRMLILDLFSANCRTDFRRLRRFQFKLHTC